jgi:hypothetical protein
LIEEEEEDRGQHATTVTAEPPTPAPAPAAVPASSSDLQAHSGQPTSGTSPNHADMTAAHAAPIDPTSVSVNQLVNAALDDTGALLTGDIVPKEDIPAVAESRQEDHTKKAEV